MMHLQNRGSQSKRQFSNKHSSFTSSLYRNSRKIQASINLTVSFRSFGFFKIRQKTIALKDIEGCKKNHRNPKAFFEKTRGLITAQSI